MRQTYRVLGYLIATAVVVQAATIAYAWFATLNDLDNGATLDADFEGNAGHMLHGVVGMMAIPLLALAMFGVSFFTKVDGAVKGAGFVLLAVAVQITLAFVSFGAPALGALHGINAFVVAGLASAAASRVGRPAQADRNQPVAA
jgi:hypothetical protein